MSLFANWILVSILKKNHRITKFYLKIGIYCFSRTLNLVRLFSALKATNSRFDCEIQQMQNSCLFYQYYWKLLKTTLHSKHVKIQ
jgi:hypothetical protein